MEISDPGTHLPSPPPCRLSLVSMNTSQQYGEDCVLQSEDICEIPEQ